MKKIEITSSVHGTHQVIVDDIDYNLGYFACKHEAARAYNKKALLVHGEYARLNEVD